jgi:hypothetical protein
VEGRRKRYVLADKEHVDGAEVELVKIRQGCDTVSTRVHARVKL